MSSSVNSDPPQTSPPKNPKNVAIFKVTCDKNENEILKLGVVDLFKLYFDELFDLGCDLGFQGFANEWIDLPGKYDFHNQGGLYVAVELLPPLPPPLSDNEEKRNGHDKKEENIRVDLSDRYHLQNGRDKVDTSVPPFDVKNVVGVVGLKQLNKSCGEVKRMYIRKSWRRFGIGKMLAEAIIMRSWECGYEEIKLDSLERLVGALKLYENMGFKRIPPYCECPESDHVCMSLTKE